MAAVFAAILLFVSLLLRRFRKISPAEALRFGAVQENPAGARELTLSGNRILSSNVFLGVKDVLGRKGLYSTMLAVLVIAAFLMIVPQNIHSTISSDDFITYMGIGSCDMLALGLMHKTGLSGLEKRDITQVSGGQLQRAGICRALMADPRILFGDEPTGALNSKAADDIMDLLSEINEGGTAVMLVTHDARVAARAGRVLFMQDGQLVNTLSLTPFRKEALDSRTQRIRGRMRDIEI